MNSMHDSDVKLIAGRLYQDLAARYRLAQLEGADTTKLVNCLRHLLLAVHASNDELAVASLNSALDCCFDDYSPGIWGL